MARGRKAAATFAIDEPKAQPPKDITVPIGDIIDSANAKAAESTEEEKAAAVAQLSQSATVLGSTEETTPGEVMNRPVWADRIPWAEISSVYHYGMWDSDGGFTATEKEPMRDAFRWWKTEGESEIVNSLHVMPDFADQNDWRTSLCKRPERNPEQEAYEADQLRQAGIDPNPPQEPATDATPAPAPPPPLVERTASQAAWANWLAKLNDPATCGLTFSDVSGLDPIANSDKLYAAGLVIYSFAANFLKNFDDIYEKKDGPVLKFRGAFTVDLTGPAPEVATKLSGSTKWVDEIIIKGDDSAQTKFPFAQPNKPHDPNDLPPQAQPGAMFEEVATAAQGQSESAPDPDDLGDGDDDADPDAEDLGGAEADDDLDDAGEGYEEHKITGDAPAESDPGDPGAAKQEDSQE